MVMRALSLVACQVRHGTGDEGAVSGRMPGMTWYR